jgi:hypothetical protein
MEGSPRQFPSYMEGIIHKRVCNGDEFPGAEALHNICTDEIIGYYRYEFEGALGQLPIKQLIEDLQLLQKSYEAAGIK